MNAITIAERAAVALGSSKATAELTALAEASKSIVAVTNKDGRAECHTAYMIAADARIAVEKTSKAAREDATAFSKRVIAEEKRLVAIIEPEEKRLKSLRDAWDVKAEAERAARAETERQRIIEVAARIADIRQQPFAVALSNSSSVQSSIERLEALEIDDSFEEFHGEATAAKDKALTKLREMHVAKLSAENEAARVKAKQEAEAARLKAEREAVAAERAEMSRLKQIADQEQAERNRAIEAREREIQAQRDEIARKQGIIDAKQPAESTAIADSSSSSIAVAESTVSGPSNFDHPHANGEAARAPANDGTGETPPHASDITNKCQSQNIAPFDFASDRSQFFAIIKIGICDMSASELAEVIESILSIRHRRHSAS